MINHDRYESIKNVFKRDPNTYKIIPGEFSQIEVDYLQDCKWNWTEKVDGMNVRAILDCDMVDIRGRGNNASMPGPLMDRMRLDLDTEEILEKTSAYGEGLCLYGEGAGAGIQSGSRYGPEQFFVMFDAMTDYGWASRRDMLNIAEQLNIMTVPLIFTGTINNAIAVVRRGLISTFGDFFAEGLVGRPILELQNQWGSRIITKIKHRDFYKELTLEGLT